MASKKVNINLSNNLCDIQIYVDPVKQRQAERLIAKTVLFQQPLQHFLCLAAVIGIKERGNEAEEVAVHALRPLHILWRPDPEAPACFPPK